MLKCDEKNYTVKFSIDRIKRIEAAMDQSFVALIRKTGGYPSINDLCVMVGFGLQDADGKTVPYDKASAIVEQMIVNEGYNKVLQEMEKAIENDCPFFFLGV